MLKRVVDVVELVALACAAVTIVLLFTNEPDDVDQPVVDTSVATTAPVEDGGGGDVVDGAAVYDDSCAGCHGDDGGGGVGPQLAGGAAVEAFPDPADQIAVVTDGRGGMPAFRGRLTTEEIVAVVEYTRTGLG